MKKIILMCIMLLTSCRNNQDILYYKLVEQLKNIEVSSSEIPFTIDISVSKLTDMELVYHVIIDNPEKDSKEMSVLVIHDIETESIFPSLGVVDDKVDLLINNEDTENSNIKGIALVGYLPIDIGEEINFKVMIEHKDTNNNKNTIYYTHKVTRLDME
ncbi:MAG: hypothetical protein PHW32_00245 [Bacilli bacterium]|nr:hypothetical protein [Bacilli bacterium]MDD4718438.1 hypothetical protein [Bacilli bacterium]